MAISTYTELQIAVLSWTHRDGDTAFTALIPDFVRMAEARFNRILRTRAMEADFAQVALSDGAASLPADFLAFKELRFVGDVSYTLQPKSLEWIRSHDASASEPRYFAVTGSQVVCWPTAGDIAGTYYEEIPSLADNSTNWLLTAHPDLYLFATLTEAALYMQADDRIPLWAEKASSLLDAVQRTDDRDSFDGGILAVVAR